MADFFYRFDGLNLIPGNKASGFVVHIATDAMMKLHKIPVAAEQYQALIMNMRERVARVSILSTKLSCKLGAEMFNGSACPAYFTTDPIFGGSVGANPNELVHLSKLDALEWIGPTMTFTPHNIDTPQQALALMIMLETWGEWAHAQLSFVGRKNQVESFDPSDGYGM